MNKLEGIKFLKAFKIPTLDLLDPQEILLDDNPIETGLSIRTSPKGRNEPNVYLPSIHNCKSKEQIKEFIDMYGKKYYIFAHNTVKPEVIGSISKLDFRNSIVIETYKDFIKRKEEIIDNRMIIPMRGDKMVISRLEMLIKDPEDYKNFKKIIYELYNIPFTNYDMEYVIQNSEVIFTDLTLPKNTEYIYFKEYVEEYERE